MSLQAADGTMVARARDPSSSRGGDAYPVHVTTVERKH